MAVLPAVYDMNEWYFLVKDEATVGTAITTGMQLLNLNGDVSVSSEVTQTLDIKSGSGRTLKTQDVFTDDRGQLTTITVPIVLDTTVSPLLHSNAFGVAVGATPASYDLASAYSPDGVLHGGASGPAVSLTCYLVSPETGETKSFVGCVITQMVVTLDSGTESGRRTAALTIETGYRPLDGSSFTGSGSNVPYGQTFHYLREYCALKQIEALDVVMNKVEYTISNPASFLGFNAACGGDPEMITRAIGGASFTMVVGVKYDANTANLWEAQRDGDIIDIELSNHATWASSTFGILCAEMKLTDNITPSGTDKGVFQDLSLMATGDVDAFGVATGNLAEVVA